MIATPEALGPLLDHFPQWRGRILALEPMEGGITNRNYRLQVGEDVVVVRIGGERTELLGIDRGVEADATRLAHRAGVGPEVVAFLEAEAILVTRFIPGSPVSEDVVRDLRGLRRIAAALRRVHSAGVVRGRFSPFRVVEAYAATARDHGVTVPSDYERAHAMASEIEAGLPALEECFCHNDLLNANFIDDGDAIRIVDWEYAGMGDPFFDLGNFAVNHQLDEPAELALLEAYLGDDATPAANARLQLMRLMSDFREAMWGIVQQGISRLEFDFAGYAARHFARLDAGAREYPRLLDQAHR